MRFEKIMLVGSEIPQSLNEIFYAEGSRVTHLPDGKMALSRAEHEMFNAAILVSTGDEMDLAETVFNLRDISGSMELIILSDDSNALSSAVPKETLVNLVPKARIMTTGELKDYLSRG